MATSAQISTCKQSMPRPITLSDQAIGVVIDAQGSVVTALAFFWEGRAAETAEFVDIEESGSSRKMSQGAKMNMEMAKYWRGKSDDSAVAAEVVGSPTTRLAIRG